MTKRRLDGKEETDFASWVRNNPRLDSVKECVATQDIDYVWHKYNTPKDKIGERRLQHIMLIEEKTHGSDLSDSQRDTMWLIDQALKRLDRIPNHQFRSAMRGDWVQIRYWGYFKLRYADSLEDGVEWNRRKISLQTLESILRFEVDPRTLRPRSDRRHHAKRGLPLFSIP